MNRECEEAEELERKDSASFHKKIKDLSCENNHKKVCFTLNDGNGNEIFEPDMILKRWAEYCENLYKDERPELITTNLDGDVIPEFIGV